MWRLWLLCLVGFVCACGSAEPVGSEGGGGSGTGGGGGDSSGDVQCERGERRVSETEVCDCVTPSYCGGAAPPQELLDELARQIVWQCHPRASDTCEALLSGELAGDAPCEEEGETCQTQSCCGDTIRCIDHVWQHQPGPCPP